MRNWLNMGRVGASCLDCAASQMVQFAALLVASNKQVPDRPMEWPVDLAVRSLGVEQARAVAEARDGVLWTPAPTDSLQTHAQPVPIERFDFGRRA
ncbi:hypothetical protein ACFRJ9_18420 [Paenarthrobacter sp. NPDC056912]|uniref:hypothetical protein n=1 Tax=Paenarthrobacter sp. NPDC056912 TaxID=3345965 RepID=UPI0036704D35